MVTCPALVATSLPSLHLQHTVSHKSSAATSIEFVKREVLKDVLSFNTTFRSTQAIQAVHAVMPQKHRAVCQRLGLRCCFHVHALAALPQDLNCVYTFPVVVLLAPGGSQLLCSESFCVFCCSCVIAHMQYTHPLSDTILRSWQRNVLTIYRLQVCRSFESLVQ